METETRERLEARATGRVQGVGFRAYVRRQAQQLGVEGWVRNERDGSLRIAAEGTREQLDRLLQAVGQGPPMAHVEQVTSDWEDPEGTFQGFSVRY